MTALTGVQFDRACGVLVAAAAGDALGAPYEFGPPLATDSPVSMTGGGTLARQPGEWTDDTSMAVAIAEVAATGADLRDVDAQDRIVERWLDWSRSAPDIGVQTAAVLYRIDPAAGALAAQARAAATDLHRRTGRTAGNGSLMRTAPVALAYLHDEDALVDAATAISQLTHADAEAGDACVLWCLAIRHAVLTGRLDLRRGLARLSTNRAAVWRARLDTAESARPADFAHNGWVVEALQAAWSAITTTAVPAEDPRAGSFAADHLTLALQAAVRGGRDTDTVAAIAGGLLGAVHGVSAVPAQWRRVLHGWPGLRTRELVELVRGIVEAGAADRFDTTYSHYGRSDVIVRHPDDDGLWLGGIGALRRAPRQVDAVVSLCRVGDADVPSGEHVEVRLIDRLGENPNLAFVLNDTVRLIETLRAEGRTVLVHCVQAYSRTPTIAALYTMHRRTVSAEAALERVRTVLPGASPNADFRAALQAFDAAT